MAFEFELPPAPTKDVKAQFGEADLIRRSASTIPQPEKRLTEVAKLIDVTKCIGCKACQVACLEWNDRTERIGFNYGVYDNPVDLTAESFTVMRFTEWVNPESNRLEWLIRKDGCMHCEDPGCLKACPSPGRHRAVFERHRRLRSRQMHRLRLLHQGMSVRHPAHLERRQEGL